MLSCKWHDQSVCLHTPHPSTLSRVLCVIVRVPYPTDCSCTLHTFSATFHFYHSYHTNAFLLHPHSFPLAVGALGDKIFSVQGVLHLNCNWVSLLFNWMGSCAKEMGCTFWIDVHNMQMCADMDSCIHYNGACVHM